MKDMVDGYKIMMKVLGASHLVNTYLNILKDQLILMMMPT